MKSLQTPWDTSILMLYTLLGGSSKHSEWVFSNHSLEKIKTIFGGFLKCWWLGVPRVLSSSYWIEMVGWTREISAVPPKSPARCASPPSHGFKGFNVMGFPSMELPLRMDGFWIPSGKLSHSYGKIHHFSWENPLFLWPFSIVMLVYQRVIPI